MDLFVLSEQLELFLEGWHLTSKDWEDVALLDSVVYSEMMAKIVANTDELTDAHTAWSLLALACAVQEVPRPTEVLVLQSISSCPVEQKVDRKTTYKHIHVLCHSVVYPELLRRQFRQVLLFLLGRGSTRRLRDLRDLLLHLLEWFLHIVGKRSCACCCKCAGTVDSTRDAAN